MKICILTYDAQHLKTEQVALTLWRRNIDTIDFLAMPFTRRPERRVLLQHRPYQFSAAHTRSVCEFVGGRYYEYEQWPELVDAYDWFIVCGSNLIESAFAQSGKIINCHAGLIPQSRGLDSFKWALVEQKEIGNTLHILDENTDSGDPLAQTSTPVFATDTLEEFARRHYESEVWLLSHFDVAMSSKRFQLNSELEVGEAKMRMPLEKEEALHGAFEEYKSRYNINE